MANNTIGTGAVVLTANADGLVAGLDKAGAATDKWAKKTAYKLDAALGDPTEAANRKAYDERIKSGQKLAEYMKDVDYTRAMSGDKARAAQKGAGLVGGLLFGAGVGVALAGVQKIISALHRIPQVEERSKNYSNVGFERQAEITRADKAFFRISAVTDAFLFKVVGSLTPAIERIASVLEVVGHVSGEVFNEGVKLVTEVVEEIQKWIDSTFGLATATTSAGNEAFAVLRIIGKGIAYFYDLNKAAAGSIVFVCGAIVDGFGQVLTVIGDAVVKLDELAKTLPAVIRPGWIGNAAATVKGWGDAVEGVGVKMQRLGMKWFGSFGDSSPAVDKWFDKVQKGFEQTDRLQKSFGNVTSGAFAQNSAEAYSVIAKFQAGNLVTGQAGINDPVAIAKKNLDENKKAVKHLQRIVSEVERFQGLLIKVVD